MCLFLFLAMSFVSVSGAENGERVEELRAKEVRIEKMKTIVSSFFEMAKESEKEEIIKDALSELIERIKSIEERIKKEIESIGTGKFILKIENKERTSGEEIVFIKRKGVTKNIVLGKFEMTATEGDINIHEIEIQLHATTWAGSIIEKIMLYDTDGNLLKESRNIDRNMSFNIEKLILSNNHPEEIVIKADVYGADRIRNEGESLSASLRTVSYSDIYEINEKEVRERIHFKVHHFYTGAPFFTLKESIYRRNGKVDIIFNFEVEAKKRNIYIPAYPEVYFEDQKFKKNYFLIRETGNLEDLIIDSETKTDFQSITSARKREDSYIINEGEIENFELWISLETKEPISGTGIVYLDAIPWGISPEMGITADAGDSIFFENLFRTNRLMDDRIYVEIL